MRNKLTDSRSVINITSESSGIYFLKLSIDDKVVTKRIMLQ